MNYESVCFTYISDCPVQKVNLDIKYWLFQTSLSIKLTPPDYNRNNHHTPIHCNYVCLLINLNWILIRCVLLWDVITPADDNVSLACTGQINVMVITIVHVRSSCQDINIRNLSSCEHIFNFSLSLSLCTHTHSIAVRIL